MVISVANLPKSTFFSILYLPSTNWASVVVAKKSQAVVPVGGVIFEQLKLSFITFDEVESIAPLFLCNHKYKLLNSVLSKNSPVLNVKLYCSSIALITKLAFIAGFKSSGKTPLVLSWFVLSDKLPTSVRLPVSS